MHISRYVGLEVIHLYFVARRVIKVGIVVYAMLSKSDLGAVIHC